MPTLPPRPFSGRNRAVLAREAWFQAQADAMVRKIIFLGTGGQPEAMRLCLKYALPVGRGRPLPIRLPPLESPEERRRAIRTIGIAAAESILTVREAAQLLEAIDGPDRRVPDIATWRKLAAIEGTYAKAAAALGIDHFFTASEGPHTARAAAIRAAEAAESEIRSRKSEDG